MSEIIKTKVTVNSSLIESIVYDRSTKVMEVFYKKGTHKNKPFVFTLIFNLNRNKVTFASKPKNYTTVVK